MSKDYNIFLYIWVSVYFQRRKILWNGSVIVWLKWLFFVLVASPTAWRIILAFHRRLWREFLNEESGNTPLLYRIQGCYDQTGDPTLFHWEHRKSSPEYCFRSLLWLLREWQWSENQFIGTFELGYYSRVPNTTVGLNKSVGANFSWIFLKINKKVVLNKNIGGITLF